jgi:hypothetical protein
MRLRKRLTHPMWRGAVDTLAPVALAIPARAGACTPGLVVDCIQVQVAVFTLAQVEASIRVPVEACIRGPAAVSTRAPAAAYIPARAAESIQVRQPKTATKGHGVLASRGF